MMSVYLKRNIKMIKKNGFIIMLMWLLITISLVLTGSILKKQDESKKKAEDFKTHYGNNSCYWVCESLDDLAYYTYMEGDEQGVWYQQLRGFEKKLEQIKDFEFYTCMTQPIELEDKVDDIFLEGYEDIGEDIREDNQNSLVKAVMVSKKFFSSNQISLKKGRSFTEDDYSYKKGKNIPVILGNAYAKNYKIGEKIQAKYLMEDMTLEIIGFLNEKNFYLSSENNEFVSLERYIILPAFQIDERSEFSKYVSLMELNGNIQSNLSVIDVRNLYQRLLDEQGLDWEYNIQDPNNLSQGSVVKKYSKMTEQVKNQFAILVVLVCLFSGIALLLNLFQILEKNKYVFGIELLCGACYKDIFKECAIFIAFIMLQGDLWASLALSVMNVGIKNICIIQVMMILITSITYGANCIYIKRMHINEIIGGTE